MTEVTASTTRHPIGGERREVSGNGSGRDGGHEGPLDHLEPAVDPDW